MKQTRIVHLFSVCRMFGHMLGLMLLMLGLSACGGKQDPPGTMPPPAPAARPQDVTWNFQKDAITLTVIASEDLNKILNESHAVSICLYQTENPDALKAKAETIQGLRELLECKSSPPERLQAQHIYVQPGSVVGKTLDRAEKAKYLAVVAGFDVLNPATCFSIIPFPLHTESTGQMTFFFSQKVYNAAEVEARIDLSSESVHLQGIERVQK